MKGERLVVHRLGMLGLVCAVLGTACSPFPNSDQPSTGPDIVIGVPNAATGSVATEGALSKQGYDLWRDQVDRAGGILVQGVRHKVRLVYGDDQSLPQQSAQV